MFPVPMTPTVLRGQVEAEEAFEREVAVADPVVGARDPPVEGEHQRQRVLGDRVRRVRRHADHGHAASRRRRQIDVVVAGATEGDEPHALVGERRDHVGAEVVVHERAHRLVALRQARSSCFQP